MRKFASAAAWTGAIALAVTTAAGAVPETPEIARPDVQAMSSAEIRAFNATLPPKHRYYVLCKRSSVTGSLAKVTKICQTREDWERGTRAAQDSAHGAVERGRASAGCDPWC